MLHDTTQRLQNAADKGTQCGLIIQVCLTVSLNKPYLSVKIA
jgi:hypothetical protein